MHRIVRSFATLVALLVAYQVYALVAVPLLEPTLAARKTGHSTEEDRQQAAQAPSKYQRLLAAYFPTGHWSLVRPPKVIESGSVMLVLDDYQRHEDGRVDLTKCALLFFPTPRQEGIEPPRDAIIIEAPRGAYFQFDGKFQPERSQIPPIKSGQFPGPITIRSDMHEPGQADDLLVETTDLEMNSKLLYTANPVRFRLGPNVGGGQELEIRFLIEEHGPSGRTGWTIAGIDTLEIRREVRLRAVVNAKNLLPGRDRASPNAAEQASPLELTCSGPFHFDFVRYVASFDQDVELWQVNPTGPGDQLSCQQLDLVFAPRQQPDGTRRTVPMDSGARQKRELRRLEPAKIVARGHPVVVTSPSHEAEARGERIQLGLVERKVAIDGGSDVRLVYGPNVIRAPAIEYQQPPAEAAGRLGARAEATRIGTFWADGPGTLHFVPDPAKPDETLDATWQTSVELGRHNGQPVLAMAGRPQLAFATMGRLAADEIKIFLRELSIDPEALDGQAATAAAPGSIVRLPATQGDKESRVVPDRMTAIGQVQFHSAQLTGQAHELVASFRVEPQPSSDGGQGTVASGGATGQLDLAAPGNPRGQTYQIEADHLRVDVALHGRRAVATGVSCEGRVAFHQLPGAAGVEPLEVRGGQLAITDLDSAAHIKIIGASPGEPAGSGLARFQGRGVTVLAAGVEMDQGQNRLWSDGPGKATMLLGRDLEGRPVASPYPLEITWTGGLEFDGRQLVFNQQVLVQGADDWLRCQQLVARLAAPIRFGARLDQDCVELAEIECRGQVVMDRRTRDELGPTSHERVELEQLTINQQNGAISGSGPGSVRSTHLASQTAALAQPMAPGSPPAADGGAQLRFLRVDFEHGLGGNYYTRELRFSRRVRTVYGTVDSWEQELDIGRPEGWPPGTVTLTCEELRVNEDPVPAQMMPRPADPGSRALGPMELHAGGNVYIQGSSPTLGTFAAQADRATYQQAKDLFVLEGTQRVPATIWQQRELGGQLAQNSARKIQYWRATGQVKVEDIRAFEFTPTPVPPPARQNARGPAPLRQ
jgi:hypothetical protein